MKLNVEHCSLMKITNTAVEIQFSKYTFLVVTKSVWSKSEVNMAFEKNATYSELNILQCYFFLQRKIYIQSFTFYNVFFCQVTFLLNYVKTFTIGFFFLQLSYGTMFNVLQHFTCCKSRTFVIEETF